MASVIRIKRSDSNGNPSTLAAGELAYSALAGTQNNGGDRLYIGQGTETNGNAANHIVIGGKYFTDMLDHTPGTLTTSSAIVTDANNKIDILNVDNITLNGNTISSTNLDGNLVFAPNGSGQISFYNAYTFPTTAGTAGYALVSDGAGGLTWAGVSTANTATNIAGGAAGQIPIQSGAGTTAFIPTGTAGQLLVAGSNTATFVNTSSVYVGRATTADAWAVSRTLTLGGDLSGSVSFDGSGNFTLTATIAADSVALGTDTTGNYVASGATSGFGLSGSASAESATFTVSSNATSTNATGTLVFRDDSGNFAAGTITASLTGVATTATNVAGGTAGQLVYQSAAGTTTFAGPGTAGQLLVSGGTSGPSYTNTGSIYVGAAVNAEKWATARTVTFTGDTTGTFTIDGSGDVSNVTLTIQPDSVALGTDTTGNYVASGATSGFGLSGSAAGENQTFTVTSNATSTNATNTIVFRDGSGNFAAGTITADLTGVATTATNVAGGTAGQVPYQTAAGATSFYGPGTSGDVLVSGGTGAPVYQNTLALSGTTAATSTSTGAFTVAGGVGIGGSLYVGGEIVATKLTIELTTITTTLVTTDDIIKTTNTTAASSTTTGALQIAGGAGIGGNLYVGGTIYGTIDGSITTATNLSGGTAGQIVYQSAAGITSFAGPGTAGQLLVSGGTSGPSYTNTASIYVGAAVNAEKWATARTVTFTGDTTGTFTIDGSGDVSNVTLTIQPDSVALGTDTTGNYVASGATSGFGLSGSSSSESGTFTVTSNATSTNATSTLVYRDALGNFAANAITADLVGTATTATNLTGGAAGSVPYQTAAGITAMLALGTAGKVLQVSTNTNEITWGDIDGGTY